ncbi:MAG: molybdopterin-dependent oxidoreductase, partial [Shimia sp.]
LDRPYVRIDGKLKPATWPEALNAAAKAMNGAKVSGLVGDLAPVEATFALKTLIEGMGGEVECRTDGAKLPAGNRSGYVGTARVADIDEADHVLLIGTNPRIESPVLNARIRKTWLRGASVGMVGPSAELSYDYAHAGTGRDALTEYAQCAIDNMSGQPSVIVVGQGALGDADGAAVLAEAMRIADASGAKLLVLHTAAARVGAMDVGAVSEGGIDAALQADVIYNLGADEIDIPAGPFVIYQGSHGDRGAHRADVILPGAAYTEEQGLFVNTEGRPQLALRAGFAPGEAKENWAILRALSAELGQTLPFDSLAQLRQALVKAVPHLAEVDEVPENAWQPTEGGDLGTGDFTYAMDGYYQTNPIARASKLMGELAANAAARDGDLLAAE